MPNKWLTVILCSTFPLLPPILDVEKLPQQHRDVSNPAPRSHPPGVAPQGWAGRGACAPGGTACRPHTLLEARSKTTGSKKSCRRPAAAEDHAIGQSGRTLTQLQHNVLGFLSLACHLVALLKTG